MKSALIKFAMYTAIFLVVGILVYFFVFARPNSRRIEELNYEIAAAQDELIRAAGRDAYYPELVLNVAQASEELSREQEAFGQVSHVWNSEYAQYLPESVVHADIYQRVYRITSPHDATINTMESQPLGTIVYDEHGTDSQPGLWLTPVNVSFVVSYESLIQILNSFANEGIDNRVVVYNMNRLGDMWDVSLQLDILTRAASNGMTATPTVPEDIYGVDDNDMYDANGYDDNQYE